MIRSLWTAASGMNGQQANVDVISNNLSNVNTTGYKPVRAEFEDLIYQTQSVAGTPATDLTSRPIGTQIGHGVRVASTQRMFLQGSLKATGSSSDVAIVGEGFLRVMVPSGSVAYTRDGSFKIDSSGQIVTSQGYRLQPEISLPEGFHKESLNISQNGEVTVKIAGGDDPVVVGQLELYRFVNPEGLSSIGENLFSESVGSGEVVAGLPGVDGMGQLKGGFLEMSAVSAVKEMVNLIVAQRAYEFSSKAIQTSDSMLGTAIGIKRS